MIPGTQHDELYTHYVCVRVLTQLHNYPSQPKGKKIVPYSLLKYRRKKKKAHAHTIHQGTTDSLITFSLPLSYCYQLDPGSEPPFMRR